MQAHEGAVTDGGQIGLACRVAGGVETYLRLGAGEHAARKNDLLQGLTGLSGDERIEHHVRRVEGGQAAKSRLLAEALKVALAEGQISGLCAVTIDKLRDRDAFDRLATQFDQTLGGSPLRGADAYDGIALAELLREQGGIDRLTELARISTASGFALSRLSARSANEVSPLELKGTVMLSVPPADSKARR